jgi:glycosyltransferase involved in cell wall biosynthesis
VAVDLGNSFLSGNWAGTTTILAQVEWLDLSDVMPGSQNPTGPVTMTVGLLNSNDSHGVVNTVTRVVTPTQNLSRSQTPTLTVAGEFWADTTEMDNLIAELGLADRVTLRPGYVPADEIPALFGAADALVMPYREATASQNALLAFAHRVPVITTTAGVLAEPVRDGVDGLTCAPGDTEDLVRVLKEFSDPQVARRLRAGIPAVDPDRGWDGYLRVLLVG